MTTDLHLSETIARFEAEAAAGWQTLVDQTNADGPDRFVPVQTGSGIGVIANRVSYPIGTLVDDVVRGTATPESIEATSDGRSYVGGWHRTEDGPESEALIYVERWTPAGRTFHGWIDPVSRRLVQAG